MADKVYSQADIMAEEFIRAFISQMEKKNVKIKISLRKKKVALLKRFNKTQLIKLFAYQYNEVMKNKKRNCKWISRLSRVIMALSDEEAKMIGMKPLIMIKLASVKQPEYRDEHISEDLPMDSYVRYLYKHGEAERENQYRATNPKWSTTVHGINEIRSLENKPSLYIFQDSNPEITFTRGQLQFIPGYTEHIEIETI